MQQNVNPKDKKKKQTMQNYLFDRTAHTYE